MLQGKLLMQYRDKMVIPLASPLVSPTVSPSVSSVGHSVPPSVSHPVPSTVGHSVPPSVSHPVSSTVGHSSPPSVSHPVLPSTVGHSVPPSVSHPVQSTFTVPIVSKVGGGHPLPYMSSIDELNKDVIVSILSNPDKSKVITLPPVKPKGGDIFVICSENVDDWKCDQYMWMRDGLRKFQYKDVEFSKINYKSRLPGVEIKSGCKRPNYSHKFKKLGHWLHSDPHLVLVHYLGDETIYKPMAHGNSKHETEFKRTMPSVIDKMKSEEGGAKKVYRKMVCTDQWQYAGNCKST
jgi:hypothetical protein